MSNLLDKASIVLTPTAYDNGKVLCVKPSDGSGDFDFSRATEGTRVNAQGLIENEANNLPRINYEAGCGSWLFEPQSTNLQINSENQGSGSGWVGGNISVVGGQSSPSADSPLGAYDIIENTNTSTHRLRGGTFTTVAAESTLSLYVKYSTKRYIELRELISNSRCRFDLLNNVIVQSVNAVGKIEDAGNGFKRISITYTATGTTSRVQFALLSDSQGGNYQGNGTDKVTVFGFQVEQANAQGYSGTYATSYIKTSATTVTRNRDLCTNGGSVSTINSTSGVLYFEGAALVELDTDNKHISISDGAGINRFYFYYDVNGKFGFASFVGGVLQANITYDGIVVNNSKVACKYKENDYALWVNGVEVGTDTSASVWSRGTLNTLQFGNSNGTSNIFFGKTKALAVWKEALTDAELTALTTI